jgi:hypothetical protein
MLCVVLAALLTTLGMAQTHFQESEVLETHANASVLKIRGTAVAGGVSCPLIELVSGERVPLVGVAMDAYPYGTRLALSGYFMQRSPCQQGRLAFRVLKAQEQ